MASETQTTGEETRLDATQATGEDTRHHGIQYLDLISNKLTCIEKRQCDASGEGTDAARMVEEWTRGENCNITEAARAVLARRVILARSAQATTYASLFSEKDYVRAEKQVWLFWRGYHRNEIIGHMDSEDYADVGASFCELPLFRGKECMSSEIMLELAGVPDGEFKNAMKLETHLEHLAPLSIEYQELTTPLNKRFEWSDYRVSNVENTTQFEVTRSATVFVGRASAGVREPPSSSSLSRATSSACWTSASSATTRESEVLRKVVDEAEVQEVQEVQEGRYQGLPSLHGQVVRGDPPARRSEAVGD